MIYQVIHHTDYQYDDFVSYCHNLATLKPRNIRGQQLLSFNMEITPNPSEIEERTDFFGNHVTRFSIQEIHKQLTVTTKSFVLRDYTQIVDSYNSATCRYITLEEAIEQLKLVNPETLNARQYILESPLIRKVSPEIKTYASVSFQPKRPVFEAAYELMQRIHNDFEFVSGFSDVATPLQKVFQEKKGVCQDFAQVAIACVRSVGLPARYMSGYIETIPPEGKEKLVGADASHAWFSIFIPGFGWVEFDPTNNMIPSNQHLVVAWGRDYYDVPPLKGVIYSHGKNEMTVSVDIRPADYQGNAMQLQFIER